MRKGAPKGFAQLVGGLDRLGVYWAAESDDLLNSARRVRVLPPAGPAVPDCRFPCAHRGSHSDEPSLAARPDAEEG